MIECHWCGVELEEEGLNLCPRCQLPPEEQVLRKPFHIWKFIQGPLNRKIGERTVARHIEAGLKIRPAKRGGGFTKAEITRYARTFANAADGSSPAASTAPLDATEAAASKAEADAELRRLQAAREQIRLDRDRRQIIPRGLYERDLAARLAFFSNQLDVYAVTTAKDLVDRICGDQEKAGRIADMVAGDREKAMELIGHFQRMVPEIADLILKNKQSWLSAFARDRVHVVEIEEYLEAGDGPV